MRGRLSRPRDKGGAATGLPPVDRRKTGSKHHLICDGCGTTPLRVITTAADVNDITQTLNLVDDIPPVAGRTGHPRRRPESVLGDKAYDSCAVRRELGAVCPMPLTTLGASRFLRLELVLGSRRRVRVSNTIGRVSPRADPLTVGGGCTTLTMALQAGPCRAVLMRASAA
ncbi:transposase [Streptomyces sp. NPDC058297]|uniref:transposase n=1 Tax=Streptomyces sp. NPDC058297 TaxID=3346433 RepID=UPI0036E5B550